MTSNRNNNSNNSGNFRRVEATSSFFRFDSAPLTEVSDRDYEKNKRRDRWENKKGRKSQGDYDDRDW